MDDSEKESANTASLKARLLQIVEEIAGKKLLAVDREKLLQALFFELCLMQPGTVFSIQNPDDNDDVIGYAVPYGTRHKHYDKSTTSKSDISTSFDTSSMKLVSYTPTMLE